jgi:hypothetical protein
LIPGYTQFGETGDSYNIEKEQIIDIHKKTKGANDYWQRKKAILSDRLHINFSGEDN